MGSCWGGGVSDSVEYNPDDKTTPIANKYQFEIKEVLAYWYGLSLLRVYYPDCKTFDGIKLLIIDDKNFNPMIDELTELDPHFLEDNNVVARFIPTEKGLKMAMNVLGVNIL